MATAATRGRVRRICVWFCTLGAIGGVVHFTTRALAGDTPAVEVAIGGVMLLAALCGVTLLAMAVVQRRAQFLAAGMIADLTATNDELAVALAEAASLRGAIDEQAIVSITDHRGRILEVNDRFCRISGYARKELLGRDHRIVNSGHHPPEFWREMWETVNAGRPWRGEVCNRAKDGSLYWVLSIIAPCRDPDGRVRRILSIRTDITAHRHAIARARLHEAQLVQAQRVAGIGSWYHDHDRRHTEWSQGMGDVLGVGTTPLAPELGAFLAAVHPDDREAVSIALDSTLPPGGARALTHRLQLPDGRIKHVHLRTEPVPALPGAGRCSVGTVQDVTATRQVELELVRAREQAEAANRTKSQFLANMSHEIRTPLTAILGCADLLEEALGDTGDRGIGENLSAIRAAGDHLLTILDDILDLSKIEAGRLLIEPAVVDVPALLQEVHTLLRTRAQQRGISLMLAMDSTIPRRVRTDPTRLRQILLNLVGNAIKFTARGGVQVRVAATAETSVVRLRCDVVDTGIGMSAEQAAMLFQPFTQANAGITRRFGGTGLGLTISRRLAEAQGGIVVLVESAPGGGSRFRVELPVTTAGDEPWITDLSVAPTAPSRTNGTCPPLAGRILLAEDGPDNRRLIGHIMRRAGATVDVADNGRIAWDMLQEAQASGNAYDLLVTDLQMPELDGCSLAGRVRQNALPLPVLVLTAHATPEDRARCFAAGCDGFAAKPIQRTTFLQLCHQLLTARAETASPSADGGQE